MTDPVAGLVVVDKPAGPTSHDVVGRVRRLAGTRRVGHAGTLDPMATGVLVVGVGRATRVLGYLAAGDKAYTGTVLLGVTTDTDDALGAELTRSPVPDLPAERIRAAMAGLTGDLVQVPPAYSAIRIEGRRAYARARAGELVEVPAREVRVDAFDLVSADGPRLEVAVTCSAGTYIRALARDLGSALGVGGHLAALRRTRVGPFDESRARTLDELAEDFSPVPLAEAVAAAFPRRDVDQREAWLLVHGGRLPAVGGAPGPTGVYGPGGALLGLVEERDGATRSLCVLADPAPVPDP